ncbi:mitochondrial fission ELM1 family protein [Methylobacterium nodulans]|uniref:mitochondrial fission ELM1 family protein n=1 Tax=Methylobacterium nodulans TaxID=114616 RepID=UPI000310BA97|nr:mitochondrial fission ELM1 family protein [Methylobacterium nodulans]
MTALPSGTTAWILTDGKAGDLAPCRGLAHALGLTAQERQVALRPPFSWWAPRGPADPRDRVLTPPWPDLALATGRRAVPALRALRRLSGGRTFTVFLRDPRIGAEVADLVWVPEHDRLRGPTVLTTLAGPHPVSPERLAAARAAPDPRLAALPAPRAAVLVGGDSRHGRVRPEAAERFLSALDRLGAEASLMITASRRTPSSLREGLRALSLRRGAFLWDGSGENPYLALLALADAVVATADSANMVGEAVATGAPVLLFELTDTYLRHRPFFAALRHYGAVHPFNGRLEGSRYEPLDFTPAIAEAVAAAYLRHRDALARLTGP